MSKPSCSRSPSPDGYDFWVGKNADEINHIMNCTSEKFGWIIHQKTTYAHYYKCIGVNSGCRLRTVAYLGPKTFKIAMSKHNHFGHEVNSDHSVGRFTNTSKKASTVTDGWPHHMQIPTIENVPFSARK